MWPDWKPVLKSGAWWARIAQWKGLWLLWSLLRPTSPGVVTGGRTHPRRHQGIFPRLEAGPVAKQLQAIRDWEVRWVHQSGRVARTISAHHWGYWSGPVRHGKLPVGLFVIICQDLAPRAPHRVSPILELDAPAVHQQLLCHMHLTVSRQGPSQRCLEEGRVPPGVHPTLLQ
jgi:hypothetical protein